MRPCAARSPANPEFQESNGKAGFEDLGIGDAGIGHMRVNTRGTVCQGRRTGPSPDRLIMTKKLITEGHVVHRSLARGRPAERAEQDVHDPLRGLDIPAHDGGAARRIENRATGNHDLDRIETASVQWDSLRDKGTEHIDHSRPNDRGGRVEISARGRTGPFEVDLHSRRQWKFTIAARVLDLQTHADRRPIIERVGEMVIPLRKLLELACDLCRSRTLELLHRDMHDVFSDLIDQSREQGCTGFVRRHHRLEIRHIVVGTPRGIGSTPEHGSNSILIEMAGTHEMKRLDQDAFLLETRRIGRHRARCLATEVRMVSAARNKEARCGGRRKEDRRYDGHVRQMRSSREGIVRHEYVALCEGLELFADRGDRIGHRTQMNRNMRRVCDQSPVAIKDGTRVVEPLFDIRRHGRIAEHRSHLFRNRHEPIAQNFEPHGIGLREIDAHPSLDGTLCRQSENPRRIDFEFKAGIEHDRAGRFENQRRAADPVSGLQGLSFIDGRFDSADLRKPGPIHTQHLRRSDRIVRSPRA